MVLITYLKCVYSRVCIIILTGITVTLMCCLHAGYGLGALFQDSSGTLQADFTSIAAHGLLHRSQREFMELSEQERQGILSSLVGVEMLLCISKVHRVQLLMLAI